MRVAVMQPYFMPYIGYFQLIRSVDTFVFFDDVNFIKKGWIHRNNLKGNNGPQLFSIPLSKASQNKMINEILLADENWPDKFMISLEHTYKKSPHYPEVKGLMAEIISAKCTHISELAETSINIVCKYLGLDTKFLRSSDLEYDRSGNGTHKILDICKLLGAKSYTNAIGGKYLYDDKDFMNEGINLHFIETGEVIYDQESPSFLPNLSIIDVMMFNDIPQIHELLSNYKITTK